MSQIITFSPPPIPPGTYIEELQGDVGPAVSGAIVNILGNGDVAPASLANSGIIFTGDGISTLSATAQYLNIPNTDLSGNGAVYLNTNRFLHNYSNGGSGNVFLGIGAGYVNALGNSSNNLGIGSNTLTRITNSSNVAIGSGAGQFLANAISNVAIGANALNSGSTASNNIAIGQLAAGFLLTGSSNIVIGQSAGTALNGAESQNILIGSGGSTGESQAIRIGSSDQQTCFIAGIDGVNVGSVARVVTMGNSGGATQDKLGTAIITAGAGITVTPGANLITISATGADLLAYTNVSTTPYTVLSTDEFLGVNSSGGAITIRLPNAPSTGRVYYIKDSTGSANTNAITVTTVGGAVTIDGATSYSMNTQYAAISVLFNGSSYLIF